MDNVAQLETDTNFQSRKKITWGVFSVLLLFLVAGIVYYFLVYRFYQSTALLHKAILEGFFSNIISR